MKKLHPIPNQLCLLCCHVLLCVAVYGVTASEMTNVREAKQQTFQFEGDLLANKTFLENDKVISEIAGEIKEFDEKPFIRVTWNENSNRKNNNSVLETTAKEGEIFAESRILLIDDGIQDDKKLQDIDSSKDDLTWRLKGTSFLHDLAREVLGVSYQNHDTTVPEQSELKENREDEKDKNERAEENPVDVTREENNEEQKLLEKDEDNEDVGSQKESYSDYIKNITEESKHAEDSDDYDSYEEGVYEYDDNEDLEHQSSDQDDFMSQDYGEAEGSIEDYTYKESNSCSKEGDCTSPNDTMSLREKLQQDLEASYSEPLPSKIKFRLKRKPSIYSARKSTTKSDIGPPDIYEKEVEVRVVPKDEYLSTGDKNSSIEGVISDHRKFLSSSAQKFIPLGAIYRSAQEGRENSEDEGNIGGTPMYSKDSDSQLPAPSGGLRKHLPFRRPFTFKAKRVHSELKKNNHYVDDDKEYDDHSQGLSTLEKITLNKTPGVAIEYPPIFFPQIGESTKGRIKRPYRKRPGKRRRKNQRRPSVQSFSQLSEYDLDHKTKNVGVVKESSSGYHQNPNKEVQKITDADYNPPKVEELPQQPEGHNDMSENSIYIKSDSSYSTTLSSVYVTPSSYLPPTPETQNINKPIPNYVPPSTNYVILEPSTTPKYTVITDYNGSINQVPSWLINMQKNNKNPTPPPGYVPETTTQQGIYKQKLDYKNAIIDDAHRNLYGTPSKTFISSCNTCQGTAGEVKYISQTQNYELPKNEHLPPNKAIIYEYSPPNNKPPLSISSFVPSQKYEPPKLEYVPSKQSYKLPSQSYEVPQKEYIPPTTGTSQKYNTPSQSYETPQNEYLPPSRSRLVDQKYNSPSVSPQVVAEKYNPSSQTYEVPKYNYSPPTKSYEVAQSYKVPLPTYEAPKNEYVPPLKIQDDVQSYKAPSQSYEVPKNEYLPPTKSHDVVQNYKIPTQSYEVPKNEYLPPTKSYVVQNYKVPLQTYEVPKNEYIPPLKSHDVAPNYKIPIQSYEVPKNEYLLPTKFHDVVQNYKIPTQSYEVPKNEYLPSIKSYDVAQNYKIPPQTYVVPINEYLPPLKSHDVAPNYKIPTQSYEVPQNEYLPPTKSYHAAQNYKIPPQTYVVPINEYLTPLKSHDVAPYYKIPTQSYEVPKNEYLPPTKSHDVAQNYQIPSQRYETPVVDYLPPDSKTAINITLQNEYAPPSRVYHAPITIKPYAGTLNDKNNGLKITTRRPNYNLRAISHTKELKTIGPSRIKQTQNRPSGNFDDNYDVELEYYLDDYDLPKSQINPYFNYDYDDDDQFQTSKLNLRQHQMIDYNFDIKENDILEYGYIIGIPGIAGIDYPILKYIPLTTFRCHLVADYPGYYADMEAGCQVFHVCHRNGRQDSFLCPNGTIFNQKYFVCDWWYNFSCEDAAFFYAVNAAIGQPNDSQSIVEVELKQTRRSNGYSKRGSLKKTSSNYRHRKRSTIVDNSRKRPYRLRRRYSVMGAMSSPVYL